MRRIAIIAFTEQGCRLALQVARGLQEQSAANREPAAVDVSGPARMAEAFGIGAYENLVTWTAAAWASHDALVFVSASGIAVRAIAPHVRDKFSDPAVVSVDERGRFAVPLLSGHVGGANDLARVVASLSGGQACVSTATDVNNLFAVDEWARKQGLALCERSLAKEVSAALLAGDPVGFACDFPMEGALPSGLVRVSANDAADAVARPPIGVHVTLDELSEPFDRTLHLIPQIVTVGAGCHRNQPFDDLHAGVMEALAEARVSPRSVLMLASIDVKADEPAMHELARQMDWDLFFYTAEELNAVPGEFTSSDFVRSIVGTDNVCERAAVCGGAKLFARKRSAYGVTAALAAAPFNVRFPA